MGSAKKFNFVLESFDGDEWITETETESQSEARLDYEFCLARDSSDAAYFPYRIRQLSDNEIVWKNT